MRTVAALLMMLAAQAVSAATAREQLDTFAKGLRSLSGSFQQTVFDANDKPGKETRGTLALEAPRQFRWDVSKPYAQHIIADGMHVWIYDPDLEQVTVRNQGIEESHSPLTVLTDLSQLDREYVATEAGERDGAQWLRLKSKAKEADFEYAELGFTTAGLTRMVFKDTLGNRTEIQFSDWKRNAPVTPGTFTFKPPAGVDVIGEVKPEAEVHPVKD
ncbi:outer membrane lipoprotein chaperone LolA [Tahibacter amnicola]|uniref:Outer-membrane lipoprotein carrier protein n=1 Tax=Tahibacter amnicola TaxID=2976241 RepID=A0ABY6BJ41_9GAMM|nr:outer membrane lipoprotein chaperone LolA [Tahibacter amnicola]UXI70026.1 outer membrane lipoprotein chaperone LolA [Tahibacter amnicola]